MRSPPTTLCSLTCLRRYGNLLEHQRGVGGSATLELDNTIRIAVGSGTEGKALAFERGQLSDAQCMLRYFRVDPVENPHTQVRLLLPGAQGERDELSSFFFRKWRSTMEDWRRQMRYPPKLSQLWRSAKELNLFGYEDDEDEERFLTHRCVVALAECFGAIALGCIKYTAHVPSSVVLVPKHNKHSRYSEPCRYQTPKPALKSSWS